MPSTLAVRTLGQPMGIRISFVALAMPLVRLALLLAAPGLDKSWGTSNFHFYVVSAASLLAAGTCVVLVISARSIRQTRILFLALSFFSLATIFSVHGLATPGHLIHDPTAAIVRSPWLASLAAGFFASLSVLTIPRIVEQSRLRLPEIILLVSVAVVGTYFAVSLTAPNWLAGFPTEREWFQHLLTGLTVALLCFAAWRYLDSYLFTRLSSQLAVMCALLFLAEAQLSMDFGRISQYSWWIYHGRSSLPFFRYSPRGVWNCYGRRIPLRSPRRSRCGMPSRSLTADAPRTSSI